MKLHGTSQINDQGHLVIGGCDTVELAENFGTPLYIMDEQLIRDNCRNYYDSFVTKYGNAEVIYASKTFCTTAMCRIVEQEGLGLDVVSGGELYTALAADFPAARIYFHGNNKTPDELELAIEAGVGRIVVDNFRELALLDRLAAEHKRVIDVLLRVTPGIEAHTHEYIQTGQIDSKFGFTVSNGDALKAVHQAVKAGNLEFKGIHCHIGSQIFELESYRHAAKVMLELCLEIRTKTGATVRELNLGGGFGIYYAAGDAPAQISDYADLVMNTVAELAAAQQFPVPKVIVEPGRSIAGPAGTTLYTIGSIKDIPGVRKYVAVDGGMADNPRPALYQASYEALVANKAVAAAVETVSITGKCCESGDMLIWDIDLPKIETGDLLAVSCTGAYNYSMSSNYNRLARPAVVLVNDGSADLIVQRETYQDLVRNDLVPARLYRPDERILRVAGR
ncbi:MAG TPA: diaminopimelate decarboxylase [Desulfobacteria bacterium]|nr:diaminopimelate decarboxylase [Desulfobacteria bacterium]